MSRPKNNRFVNEPPLFNEFKPVGISRNLLKRESLSIDEFEAVRLADYEGMSHENASREMEISRSTFSRLIEKARKKISNFIIEGKLLSVGGGVIHFRNNIFECLDCGYRFKKSIDNLMTHCPGCDSENLINFAGGFGHGRCCIDNYEISK